MSERTTSNDEQSVRTYLPAAGKDLFLPLYDPLTTLLGMGKLRAELIALAQVHAGQRVLDLGCGTGSLLIALERRHKDIAAVGLDPDPRALARAREKAHRAHLTLELDRGFADALPYAESHFDRVFSSFMFHHLEQDAKLAALSEVHRVLKPGGRIELVDFAGHDAVQHGLRRWLHAHPRLADNAEARVVELMSRAGFITPHAVRRRTTLLGPVVFYEATRAN